MNEHLRTKARLPPLLFLSCLAFNATYHSPMIRFCYAALLGVFLIAGCTPVEPDDLVFDAPKLVAKSPEEVVELLGEPDTSYYRPFLNKRYFIQYYNQYGVEVRHLNGSVSEIIVQQPYPLKFAPETITRFGIAYTEPSEYDSLAMIMWKNIEGIKVVNFYLRGELKPDSIEHSYHIFFNMDTTGRQ